jgi:outer membrane protein assembly factor BamB
MRRTVVAAAAVIVAIIAVASVYVAAPSIFRGSGGSGGPTASLSLGASVSVGSSSSSTAASTGAIGQAWTTYHADNNRTGYEPVANFTSVTPGWTSPTLDGLVFAEPLVYGGDVFVATENNSVYALSAQTGSIVWRQNLGPPVQGSLLPCGNIEPVTGITGTPVIDPSTGMLYVVAFSEMHHTLYALKVATGAVVFSRSATPPGFNDTTQQERTALTLANGMVYIGYGGLAGDCAQYWGWEVGLPASGTGSMVYYQVPTSREGAIWAPDGASVDSAGNVYVSTGNGAATSDSTPFDYGDSVIKLSPSLREEGYFAPTDWAQLAATDADLGSLAPVFVGPHTLFQIGKQGVGYLLDSDQLGGVGGQSFEANVCDESFGATAFVNGTVFVPCINGLFELDVLNSTYFSTKLVVAGFNAGPPIVTGGVVWTVDDNSAVMYGISAATGHEAYSFKLGAVEHFTTPAAGDGQVFVVAADKVMSFVLG